VDASASPFLAGILGLIPGVGAMYNGQFVKAMIHLLVFVCLVAITDHFGAAGILIAGWVFYQVFDAIHTARARAMGEPLPDPFGFNGIEGRVGMGVRINPQDAPAASAAAAPPYTAPPLAMPLEGVPAYNSGSRLPMGAIALIFLGLMFLANSMNLFNIRLTHLVLPIFLIGLGVWMYYRRMCCGYAPQNDGSPYYRAYAIQRLCWPSMVVLTGILWLLDNLHILSWNKTWGLYLLVFGVLMLARRMVASQSYYPPMPPAPPAATPAETESASPETSANEAAANDQEPPLHHRNPNEGE
jgi:hypothetical protein